MDYRELIEHDDLTGLDYVDPTIYLDELNKGNIDESTIDVELTRLLSNMTTVDHFGSLSHKLCSLSSWVHFLMITDSSLLYKDEEISIKTRVKDLAQEMMFEYGSSKNRSGFWKDLTITMNDLYEDTCKDDPIYDKVSIEDLSYETDFISNLFRSIHGERGEASHEYI